MWAEKRTVTKTATVSLHGNTYQVDAALVGRRVELVFDPFDLTELAVRFQGRDVGTAVGHRIGRHTHPAARPDTPVDEPAATATGIDYLRLVRNQHTEALKRRVNYADLDLPLVPALDPALDPGVCGDPTPNPASDPTLDAELASFAALELDSDTAAVLDELAVITDLDDPDQLDMLDLIEENHR